MAKPELNRKKYEKMKKMDHHSMEQEVQRYYQAGYEKGMAAVQPLSIDMERIEKELSEIKGMGTAKITAVMQVLAKMM